MGIEGLAGNHGPYIHAILKWAPADVIKFCDSALVMLEFFPLLENKWLIINADFVNDSIFFCFGNEMFRYYFRVVQVTQSFRMTNVIILDLDTFKIFKIPYNPAPTCLNSLLKTTSSVHSHNLRNSNSNYYFPDRILKQAKEVAISVLWNSLPLSGKIQHTLNSFKSFT